MLIQSDREELVRLIHATLDCKLLAPKKENCQTNLSIYFHAYIPDLFETGFALLTLDDRNEELRWCSFYPFTQLEKAVRRFDFKRKGLGSLAQARLLQKIERHVPSHYVVRHDWDRMSEERILQLRHVGCSEPVIFSTYFRRIVEYVKRKGLV